MADSNLDSWRKNLSFGGAALALAAIALYLVFVEWPVEKLEPSTFRQWIPFVAGGLGGVLLAAGLVASILSGMSEAEKRTLSGKNGDPSPPRPTNDDLAS